MLGMFHHSHIDVSERSLDCWSSSTIRIVLMEEWKNTQYTLVEESRCVEHSRSLDRLVFSAVVPNHWVIWKKY